MGRVRELQFVTQLKVRSSARVGFLSNPLSLYLTGMRGSLGLRMICKHAAQPSQACGTRAATETHRHACTHALCCVSAPQQGSWLIPLSCSVAQSRIGPPKAMCYQTQKYTMYQGDYFVYETSQACRASSQGLRLAFAGSYHAVQLGPTPDYPEDS